MSRVDKPVLRCDRCLTMTEDLSEMGRYTQLEISHMSGTTKWDICPGCGEDWDLFISNITAPRRERLSHDSETDHG